MFYSIPRPYSYEAVKLLRQYGEINGFKCDRDLAKFLGVTVEDVDSWGQNITVTPETVRIFNLCGVDIERIEYSLRSRGVGRDNGMTPSTFAFSPDFASEIAEVVKFFYACGIQLTPVDNDSRNGLRIDNPTKIPLCLRFEMVNDLLFISLAPLTRPSCPYAKVSYTDFSSKTMIDIIKSKFLLNKSEQKTYSYLNFLDKQLNNYANRPSP
jgi:hypothetical protein